MNSDIKLAIVIPILRAIVTGLFVLICTYSLLVLKLESADSLKKALLVASCASFITWLLRTATVKTDLEQNEYPTSVAVTMDNGKTGEFLDVPISLAKAKKVAEVALGTGTFSHATLAGRHKPLSRAEYEALAAYLQARGYLRWRSSRSPNQGVILTAKGQALFRGLLKY